MYLGRSMISLNSKRELWVATRLSTALLVWDTLFRFKAVQALILASTPAGDTRTGLLVAYSVAFACCYVVGMSCLFACSFERTRIKHFRLGLCCGGNPVRLVRLACGCASFEQHELAGYKTVRGSLAQQAPCRLCPHASLMSQRALCSAASTHEDGEREVGWQEAHAQQDAAPWHTLDRSECLPSPGDGHTRRPCTW